MINKKSSRIITCSTISIIFIFFTHLCYAANTSSQIILCPSSPPDSPSTAKQPEKDWNLIVYLAANNNLHPFSIKNLQQMLHIGSTPTSLNILAQLDGYGQKEVTRYYIEQDNPILINSFDHNVNTTSGTSESLYCFVKWAIQTYPAKHQALILWNHGSGIKDPHIWGKKIMSNRDRFFIFNHDTGLLELNRNLLDYEERGIAFNDTYETYITNQELTDTLNRISQELLNGQKIDILSMDACHMAMVEIGSQVKGAVKYMVASQEIEPGAGYNYIYLLDPFLKKSFTVEEFAQHFVTAYALEYSNFNADYTQSAINLENFEKLEMNIQETAALLTDLLKSSDQSHMTSLLKSIRLSSRYTTEFCDPDYIDFCHFHKSLSEKLSNPIIATYNFSDTGIEKLAQLKNLVDQNLNMMQNYIIKNSSGINLPDAYGLSVYFPKRSIDSYYYKTIFDQISQWSEFLQAYQNAVRAQAPALHKNQTSKQSLEKRDHLTLAL